MWKFVKRSCLYSQFLTHPSGPVHLFIIMGGGGRYRAGRGGQVAPLATDHVLLLSEMRSLTHHRSFSALSSRNQGE